MSNQAFIQQETHIVHKTQHTTKSVNVFDDYGQGSICLDSFCDSFYADDMELLEFVLETVRTGEYEAVDAALSSVYEDEKGMYIESTWYQWEQIKPVFEKVWDQNS